MPKLIRPPSRECRTWAIDSRRWSQYRPRADDIVITTYPKCGTTWMQRIVGMLVFASPEPRSIHDASPWPDARMRDPIEVVMARLEAQTHRRFIKAHLPLDCLPLYEEVKYLHVARDGRDACMSWHNHQLAYTPEILARFDRIGLEDATIGRPYPRPSADPRDFFHGWITQGTDGSFLDFFDFELTYWTERHRETVLLVHYNDLKADLADEMHRIAEFLNIDIPAASWPDIVEAAGFESMRRDSQRLLPDAGASFDGGAQRFLFKGTNDRWRAVVDADDLALYATKVEERFSPSCARWMESGRLVAGDPRSKH